MEVKHEFPVFIFVLILLGADVGRRLLVPGQGLAQGLHQRFLHLSRSQFVDESERSGGNILDCRFLVEDVLEECLLEIHEALLYEGFFGSIQLEEFIEVDDATSPGGQVDGVHIGFVF